jgi:2-dehydro-3-deoxyphosphogluconate aldolase/(4S)-4-hydroxy-2-oxoglutarate aldolase
MARFDRLTVLNTVLQEGLVPLFYHHDIDTADQIASALAGGGSHVLEFTNRGDFALEVFCDLVKHVAHHHPDMILGVGSVEDAPTAALFIARGANFVVGPTFDDGVARLCNRRKIAYIPGCGSLNEIATAEEWGAEIVKVFPGHTVGGPEFVNAVLGPRPWTRIMPTGGIAADKDSLRAWFEAGVACVGMGSRLVRKDWVLDGDYEAIQDSTATILNWIKDIRSTK